MFKTRSYTLALLLALAVASGAAIKGQAQSTGSKPQPSTVTGGDPVPTGETVTGGDPVPTGESLTPTDILLLIVLTQIG